MLNRLVTAPDGVEWIVGRAFLFGPPRYIGFRFGRDRRQFEPPRIRRVPVTGRPPRSPTARVTTAPIDWAASDQEPAAPIPKRSRRRRTSYRHRGGTIFLPTLGSSRSSGGSWSSGSSFAASSSAASTHGSGSGSSWVRSGGGGTRSFAAAAGTGSGFSRSGGSSSGGKSKGKGGGAAGGLAGIGALLVKVAKIALIVIAIAVATWLTIFVLIPALIFALWGLLIGLAVVRHAVFRQPWIVQARENRPAPNVRAWAVQGWRESRAVVDEVADAIAEGIDPRPLTATPVRAD